MNEEVSSIISPSLHWFSYGCHTGLSSSKEQEITLQWVKQEYQKILSQFAPDWNLDLRKDSPSQQFDLLKTKPRPRREINENLKLGIYPQSIHDSYALNLNLYCPDPKFDSQNQIIVEEEKRYQIGKLGTFNPDNCFQPFSEKRSAYLGQTLLLSGYLDISPPENIHNLDELAKQCWLSFFHLEDSENFPPLYRAYKLFGGYLYEYGNPEDNLEKNPYGHLLIWFLFEESPTLILQNCYWQLPELLLYYHKVCKTFQDSRVFYSQADEIVTNNESELNEFSQGNFDRASHQPLSEDDLKTLKTTLKKLLKTSLDYSKQLRNLEYARNTIAINTKNYQKLLNDMAELADSSMEGFQVFANKDAIAFQEQISADLNYFNQGSTLLNQAIASIRGLVEIDQAERDRQRYEREKQRNKKEQELRDQYEEAEKERDRRSQTIIFMAGAGITAGGIFASTTGKINQENPFYFPWQEEASSQVHPFVIYNLLSISVSIIAALLAALLAQLWWSWKREKN